jgi:predicted 3-demethylubiquinone-9 3-methyltransferase (glyoxalase superfamily)
MQNKIIPSLWFAKTGGDVTKIVAYYQGIFGAGFEAGQVMDMGDTPSGKTQLCQVKIFGQRYNLMSTQKEQADFNDAFALTIECDNQEEIDYYWEKLSAVPEAEQCGWVKDKYGVSWQIVPTNMDELMKGEDASATQRKTQAMLQMKKIDIQTIKQA